VITAKTALDDLFKNVKFDSGLYKKIMYKDITFITRNDDHKNFFGGQVVGCYPIYYGLADQEGFFVDLFDISFADAQKATKSITTINQTFKISSDTINLVIMYVAYRFYSSKDVSHSDKEKYVLSILDYFNYRTLAVLVSNYFTYPISENEAVSLFERLSNRYIIKNVKNWREYCQYRSKKFYESRFIDIFKTFKNDKDLVDGINDLFKRTKDMLLNIYREFIDMSENEKSLGSRKTSVKDIEGNDVLADRSNTPETYYNYLLGTLSDGNSFIKEEIVDAVSNIVKTVEYDDFKEFLLRMLDYTHAKKDNFKEVTDFMHDVISSAIEYLMENDYIIREHHNLLYVMDKVSSNILYARGGDLAINEIKDRGEVIVMKITKHHEGHKKVFSLRNAFYVYIVLRALTKKYYSWP
jgi:hypothetical protein